MGYEYVSLEKKIIFADFDESLPISEQFSLETVDELRMYVKTREKSNQNERAGEDAVEQKNGNPCLFDGFHLSLLSTVY